MIFRTPIPLKEYFQIIQKIELVGSYYKRFYYIFKNNEFIKDENDSLIQCLNSVNHSCQFSRQIGTIIKSK